MSNKNGVTPAAAKYATQLYEELKRNALTEIADNKEYLVFRGNLGQAYATIKASQSYYSRVRKVLLDLGCITFIERGGRNMDTVLLLNHPPTDEAVADLMERASAAKDLTTGEGRATLEEYGERITALENWRLALGGMNIAEAFRDIERRLLKLEAAKLGGSESIAS